MIWTGNQEWGQYLQLRVKPYEFIDFTDGIKGDNWVNEKFFFTLNVRQTYPLREANMNDKMFRLSLSNLRLKLRVAIWKLKIDSCVFFFRITYRIKVSFFFSFIKRLNGLVGRKKPNSNLQAGSRGNNRPRLYC